jgi:hypothetical protein
MEVIVTPPCGVQVTRAAIGHAQFATLPPWRVDRLPSQYRNAFWSLNCSGANKVAQGRKVQTGRTRVYGPGTCFHVVEHLVARVPNTAMAYRDSSLLWRHFHSPFPWLTVGISST